MTNEDWEPPPQLNRCNHSNEQKSEQGYLFSGLFCESSSSPREVSAVELFYPDQLTASAPMFDPSVMHDNTADPNTQHQSESYAYGSLIYPNVSPSNADSYSEMTPKNYTSPIAAARGPVYDRFDLADLQMAIPKISLTHSTREHMTDRTVDLNSNFNDTSYEYSHVDEGRDDDDTAAMLPEEAASCAFCNILSSLTDATTRADTYLVDALVGFADRPTSSIALDPGDASRKANSSPATVCGQSLWSKPCSQSSFSYNTSFTGSVESMDYSENDWAELEVRFELITYVFLILLYTCDIL